MAQVYGIPQYPVYSPLAGIADLYKTYKDVQRQEAQDAYAKEKDARMLGQKDLEIANQRDYQQRSLDQNDPIAMQRKAYQIVNDPNSNPGEIAAAQNMYGKLTYMMDPTRTIERDQQMKAIWSQMFGNRTSSPLLSLGGMDQLPFTEQPLPPGVR